MTARRSDPEDDATGGSPDRERRHTDRLYERMFVDRTFAEQAFDDRLARDD